MFERKIVTLGFPSALDGDGDGGSDPDNGADSTDKGGKEIVCFGTRINKNEQAKISTIEKKSEQAPLSPPEMFLEIQ